jgi:4'-phosphopantetheinyl transferase EntD
LLDALQTTPPYTAQVLHQHRYGVIAGTRYTPGPLPARVRALLHPEEHAAATAAGPARFSGWVAGRLALRGALRTLGSAPMLGPILATERGAPALPEGFVGSISHKDGIALALVARDKGQRLGIDIEAVAPVRGRIASRVLRPEELAAIEGLSRDPWWRQVIIRYSLKEASYKAVDAYVGGELGFKNFSTRLQIRAPALAESDFEAADVTLEGHAVASAPVNIQASHALAGEFVISAAEARQTG